MYAHEMFSACHACWLPSPSTGRGDTGKFLIGKQLIQLFRSLKMVQIQLRMSKMTC